MRDLAAQSAADAGLDDARDRVRTQGIGRRLHGERWTTREANAGMISGADLVVDTEFGAHSARAGLEPGGVLGADAALTRQLTLAVRDNDLEAGLGGAHRLFQRLDHRGDAVGAH